MEWDPHRPGPPPTPSSMSSGNSGGSSARAEKTPNFKQLSPSPSVAALSKVSDAELRMKDQEELLRLLRRVESDYKSLLGEHGAVVKDVNRRLQIFVLETRELKETLHRLQEDNQELRDLCCFLDDDRQRGRKLAREWQRFGRYTASVMRSEVAVYQEKLKELENRQSELITENMDLKELCIYLDQERSRGTESDHRDDGDGSSSGTVAEDGAPAVAVVQGSASNVLETSGSITPTPSGVGNYPSTSSSTASYINELETKVQRLEEEKSFLSKRLDGSSIDDVLKTYNLLDGHLHLEDDGQVSGFDMKKDGERRSLVTNKPEAVVHAMKVLEVHEELEKTPTEEDLDAPEKAIVREMCNVVWRKLGDVGDVGNLNESSDSILDPPYAPQPSQTADSKSEIPPGPGGSDGNPSSSTSSNPAQSQHGKAHSYSLPQPQPQMASTPLAAVIPSRAHPKTLTVGSDGKGDDIIASSQTMGQRSDESRRQYQGNYGIRDYSPTRQLYHQGPPQQPINRPIGDSGAVYHGGQSSSYSQHTQSNSAYTQPHQPPAPFSDREQAMLSRNDPRFQSTGRSHQHPTNPQYFPQQTVSDMRTFVPTPGPQQPSEPPNSTSSTSSYQQPYNTHSSHQKQQRQHQPLPAHSSTSIICGNRAFSNTQAAPFRPISPTKHVAGPDKQQQQISQSGVPQASHRYGREGNQRPGGWQQQQQHYPNQPGPQVDHRSSSHNPVVSASHRNMSTSSSTSGVSSHQGSGAYPTHQQRPGRHIAGPHDSGSAGSSSVSHQSHPPSAAVRLLGAPGQRSTQTDLGGGHQQRTMAASAAPGGPPQHPLPNQRSVGLAMTQQQGRQGPQYIPSTSYSQSKGKVGEMYDTRSGPPSHRDPPPPTFPKPSGSAAASTHNPAPSSLAYNQDALRTSGFRAYPPYPSPMQNYPTSGGGGNPNRPAMDRERPGPDQQGHLPNPVWGGIPSGTSLPAPNAHNKGQRLQEQEWRQTYLDDSDTL